MTKKPGPAQRRKREYLEDRTHEDPSEPEADALREAGLDWLPFNGTVQEVQE
jgi:hypothetical protein